MVLHLKQHHPEMILKIFAKLLFFLDKTIVLNRKQQCGD